MRSNLWAVLLATGLALILGGLGYGLVTFGGVPTPDAPPAVRAAEQFHAEVSGWLMLAGVLSGLAGAVGLCGRLWHSRASRGLRRRSGA